MVAVEVAEGRVETVAGEQDERVPLRAPDPADRDDGVLDGWIASLTADPFEHVLVSLARMSPRW